jgi:thiol-disulfide isomerase/thioredoxin
LLNRVPSDRLPRHDGQLAVKIPEGTSPPPPPPAAAPDPIFKCQELEGEYSAACQAFNEKLAKAKGDEIRLEQLQKERPNENDFAKRFLQLAREHPGTPAAYRSLAWISEFAGNTPTAETALTLLRQDYLSVREIGDACAQAVYSRHQVAAEQLIREVLAKAPRPMARGQACLALADFLKLKAARARNAQRPLLPAESRRLEEVFGTDALRDLKAADPAKLVAEAEPLYERVVKEFGELWPSRYDRRLGELARSALDEIRLLPVGKTAPDISGEDLDGKPLKLRDYRGKVVVLTFWATWCGPCRAQIPYQRELVKRLQGRPFVFLGVNGDGDRTKLREWLAREPLPWRSWWDHRDGDEKGQGPIARAWNVRAWPTVYVLDSRGVIRYRDVFEKELDAAVDALLKEIDNPQK